MAVFVNNQPLALVKDQSQIFGPFDLDDAALSVRIGATCSAWADLIVGGKIKEVFQATLEVSRDGGSTWNMEGGFGATGDVRNIGVEASARIGLYPGAGRKIRVTITSRVAALSTFIKIENSITVGTPGTAQAAGSSASVAVDSGSGSNRALFAFNCREAQTPLDSFTYNSVALTDIGQTTGPPYVSCRYAKNQATGSHTLAIDFSTQGSSNFILVGEPFSGVDQTTAFDGLTTATQSGTTVTAVVTSRTNDLVLDGEIFTGFGGPNASTADASQTVVYQVDTLQGNNTAAGTSRKAGASSVTMQWTESSGATGGKILAINVRADAGGGRTTKNTRAWNLGTEVGMGWRMPID